MSEKNITNILSNEHPILIRYVKPSYIKNRESKEVGEEIFQLRDDRSPPEKDISFFHSKKATIDEKIIDVTEISKKRRIGVKKTGGFLFLHALDALSEINITKEIISFKETDYPHYSMYYKSDDIMDIQEAKTILLYHCKLYLNQDFPTSPINSIKLL